ncbi:ribonuclease H-like protein [Trametes sanguinea]|nr:ribonuclease H-like protein [Trametes sanguinea]
MVVRGGRRNGCSFTAVCSISAHNAIAAFSHSIPSSSSISARGRVPGIYSSWDECQAQTAGFAGNKHQKFSSLEQARQYLSQHGVSAAVPPPSAAAASASPLSSAAGNTAKPRNAQWAALTKEIIEDESGWDVVYSDGACKGNGKVGAIAGMGVWWAENDPRNLAERFPGFQTNNRVELIAIVRCSSRQIPNTASAVCRPVRLSAQTLTVFSGFRHWMPKWIANNFKTSSGEAVKNASLIQYLSSLLDERARHGQKVHLQYIKGHAGHEGNEGADRIAPLGATLPAQPERDWKALMIAKVCHWARPCSLSVADF